MLSGTSIILSLLLLGASYQYLATQRDQNAYPAPGKLLDIGGYKLHMHCLGSGKPTVVCDAGLGGDASWWALVAQDVAQITRVCTYDRAGYGWSDASPHTRTSKHIVQELHTLLHNAQISPPYILVGHSFGGANMKLYAKTYPEEVYALVLVEACHETMNERFEAYEKQLPPQKVTFTERIKGYIQASKYAHYVGITRWNMRASLEPFFSSKLSEQQKNYITAHASSTKSLEARDNELKHIEESLKQLKENRTSLEGIQLVVISRRCATDNPMDAIWLQCQQDLVQESTNSLHLIANTDNHMITVEDPETIARAIKQLVSEYKKDM